MLISQMSPLIAGLVFLGATAGAQTRRTGNPEDHLPPNITQLAAFGERPAWSPDGKRIAFIGKSYGDAFEIDVKTKMIKLLSGHFKHAGLLRIQYLPNGDYLIIGARDFKDIASTRWNDLEMWIMKAHADSAPVPLNQKLFEGVAISRKRMRIAWSFNFRHDATLKDGESVIYTADIDTTGGVPKIMNRKEVLRETLPACNLETQDFRFDDTELIYTCYRSNGNKADVFGINLDTRAVTSYRKVEDEYNEVEGVSPDGRWALVESSKDQGGAERQTFKYLDLWMLPLEPNPKRFTRMTHFGDFEGRKAANPVVSPDGKSFAFQGGKATDPPGVGYGIFVYRIPPQFITSAAGRTRER